MEDFFAEDFVEESGISVSASQVASAIGEHNFQPCEETLRKVWKRMDRRSFYFAMAQNFKPEVAKIISSNFPFQATFPVQMDLDSERGNRIFIAVLKEVILHDSESARKIFREVSRFLDRQGFVETKQVELLKDKDLLADMKEATISLCLNENKRVDSVVDELLSKRGIDSVEVKKALSSELTKTRGTKLEDHTVKTFAQQNRIKVRQIPGKLFGKCMESDGISWGLNGRVDGLTKNKVIEVKNRKNRFMCPMYDYIQIQAYLFLTDLREAVLLERLHGANKETELTYDKLFWEEYVTPMLGHFVRRVKEKINHYTACLNGTASPGQTIPKLDLAEVPGEVRSETKAAELEENGKNGKGVETSSDEKVKSEEDGFLEKISPNSGRHTVTSEELNVDLNFEAGKCAESAANVVKAVEPTAEISERKRPLDEDTIDMSSVIPAKLRNNCMIA